MLPLEADRLEGKRLAVDRSGRAAHREGMTNAARRRRALALVSMLPLVAVGVSGAASAAPRSASQSGAAGLCRPTQLSVWQGIPGDGTAGSIYYELEFSNTSHRTCTLNGYPYVFAVNANGSRLGRVAGFDPRFAPRTVSLRPGATAHALLRLTDVGVFDPRRCRPVTSAGLRVFAPNNTQSSTIPEQLRVCSARRGPVDLSVRVVRGGVGVPGVSQ